MPDLNDFLSRIQTDHEFYFWFRKSPEEVLAAYELSTEERAALSEPSRQLWDHLGSIGQDPESTNSTPGHGTEANSQDPLTWRLRTTQIWSLDTDQSASVEPQFDQEVALERPEVRRLVSQVNAARMPDDRLTAVSALIEQFD